MEVVKLSYQSLVRIHLRKRVRSVFEGVPSPFVGGKVSLDCSFVVIVVCAAKYIDECSIDGVAIINSTHQSCSCTRRTNEHFVYFLFVHLHHMRECHGPNHGEHAGFFAGQFLIRFRESSQVTERVPPHHSSLL